MKTNTEKVQQRWDHQRVRDAEAAAAAEKAAQGYWVFDEYEDDWVFVEPYYVF